MKVLNTRTVFLFILFLFLTHSTSIYAASITVNSTCSLADAITSANTDTATGGCPAGSGADTISLLSNINLNTASDHAGAPYYLTQIKSAITIQGNGYTISGHGTGLREDSGYSFFYMFPGASSLTLNNVTIRNGSQVVRNSGGTVNITNSTIENIWDDTAIASGNFTSNIIAPGRTFIATLTISNTTIRNVEDHLISRERGGGAIVVGPGNVSITNSTISNNSVSYSNRAYGGGLFINGATISISNTTISGNSAHGYGSSGGGIYVKQGVVTISNSNISGNSATSDGVGGGIWVEGGSVTISNSTISNNNADRHDGGIRVSNGNLTLKHVTMANNSAESGAGLSIRQSADFEPTEAIRSVAGYGANVIMVNSIIADSTRGGDCVGSLDQNFHNLIQDGSCSPALSGDPKLGALTGSPAYFPLLDGSPAINTAHADHCPATDQAGTARPIGVACDIGAHESSAAAAAATVTPIATDTSTATVTATPTETDTPTATPTPTDTAIPVATETCVNAGPGAWWLFFEDNFLSGLVAVYISSACNDLEIVETSIGADGVVYTTGGQNAATALCAAGHNDGAAYTAAQSHYNADIWECVPAASTATNTPEPTATDTAIPSSAKLISSVTLLSDQPGVLEVSWNAPAAAPDDYRISWARVGEGFPYYANPGNAWPTSPSYRITDLDQGVRYKIRVRARYDGGGGDWSEPVDAEVMAAPAAANTPVPTNSAVPPTNTPVPTNSAVPPTNTPVPTNSAVPPTNTPVPTNSAVPPTNTPVPTNTAVPPTNTPIPTNTQIPPTNTQMPPTAAKGRKIASVSLASKKPGVLQVSWTVPGQSPTDYRVNWAPVGQGFPANWEQPGNVYPTTNSYTITGLDRGARYKVRVRARYDGKNGNWSDVVKANVAGS